METLDDQAKAFAEVQKCLAKATSDLCDRYQMPVVRSFDGTVDTRGESVMAVIGFAAETLRGSLLLLTSCAVVEKLRPPDLREIAVPEDVVLRDVLGEFSNMLLGRVKNLLSRRGLAPLITTPTTIIGADLKLPAPTSGLSAWHRFSCAEGVLFVRLDATFDAEFELAPEKPLSSPPPLEGVMVEF